MDRNFEMQLSKSILDMKFMRRTKDKVEKQMFQTEGEEYFGSQLTIRMKKESGKYIMEPSFMICERLTEGRLSFQGMNPDIERILEIERAEGFKEEDTKETEISDADMAEHYQTSSVSTLAKKFQRGKHKKDFSKADSNSKPYKKQKFLKPMD